MYEDENVPSYCKKKVCGLMRQGKGQCGKRMKRRTKLKNIIETILPQPGMTRVNDHFDKNIFHFARSQHLRYSDVMFTLRDWQK